MIVAPTPTGLIARATEILMQGGYRQITDAGGCWNTSTGRLFEDPYNVVGVVVLNTCSEILSSWPDLQESLVDVISRHVTAAEGKAWDGYLVLLTPGMAPSERAAIEGLRYDTSRLRKLVATGEDLSADAEVERVLRPLLPMKMGAVQLKQDSTLSMLPSLLKALNIPQPLTEALIKAYSDQASLMECLHEARGKL